MSKYDDVVLPEVDDLLSKLCLFDWTVIMASAVAAAWYAKHDERRLVTASICSGIVVVFLSILIRQKERKAAFAAAAAAPMITSSHLETDVEPASEDLSDEFEADENAAGRSFEVRPATSADDDASNHLSSRLHTTLTRIGLKLHTTFFLILNCCCLQRRCYVDHSSLRSCGRSKVARLPC
jgi:hypothetical protein